MASTATWLIIIGIVLLVAGVVLRTVSDDAIQRCNLAPDAPPLHGRELVAQYRRLYRSALAPW